MVDSNFGKCQRESEACWFNSVLPMIWAVEPMKYNFMDNILPLMIKGQ